ncbi:MAG: MarR family transcriptional regulator [Novosphingobium sp.]|nr:MarR family transcriptional regulator [Novosphingobium sp.]
MRSRRGFALRLGAIVRQMRRDFDRAASALGVTGSQWTLLAVVSSNPGATQRIIAETLDMTEAATGRLIDRMVAEGMLERRPKPDDRRAYCIHPGPRAEPVLERLALLGAEQEERLLAGFTAEERAAFSGLLDRVAGNLQA